MTSADTLLLEHVSEKSWQQWVLEAAERFGWRWYHTHDSRRSNAGWPDLVLWRPPELVFVELKRQRGKVSAVQAQTLADLEDCGCEVHVWRPADDDVVLARLRRPRCG